MYTPANPLYRMCKTADKREKVKKELNGKKLNSGDEL